MERLETRLLLAAAEIVAESFRAFQFEFTGDFYGTTVVPDGWVRPNGQVVDYVDNFDGSSENGSGSVSFTSATIGEGTIQDDGSGSGRDNCSAYDFVYGGSGSLSFNNGQITRNSHGGTSSYTDIPDECDSGGGDPYRIENSSGTFDGQTWKAEVQWSGEVLGGEGMTSGGWMGQLSQPNEATTDLQAKAQWHADSGASSLADVKVAGEVTVTGKHLRTANFAESVAQVHVYWAKGPDPNTDKLGTSIVANGEIPVYWNSGKVQFELSGLFPFDLGDAAAAQATHLLIVVDAGQQVAEADETNNLVVLELPKLAVNVVTHGFNPTALSESLGFWESFREPFHTIGQILETGFQPDTYMMLENRVASYVAEWDSSEGFLPAFFSLLVAKVMEAAADGVVADPDVSILDLQRAAQLTLGSIVLKANAVVQSAHSAVEAAVAAQRIAANVKSDFLLPDVNLSRAMQSVMLVGHSRGAAVNARVSQILQNQGYRVDEYISLDGFSTDWPDDGGLIGDISIAGEARGNRLVNYRVSQDLANAIVDMATGAANSALGPLRQMLETYTNLVADLDGEEVVSFFLSPATQEQLRKFDLRAPNRGFESETTIGETNHITITPAYIASQALIEDNCLGQNAKKPFDVLGQWPALCAPGGSGGGSGEAEAADALKPTTGVWDGSFEVAAALLNTAAALGPFNTGDEFLDTWGNLLSDPSFILKSSWTTGGQAQVVQPGGNAMAELTQTVGTFLEQPLELEDSADTLRFHLAVDQAGAGDVLEVRYNGDVLHTISLEGMAGSQQTVSVSLAGAERYGTLGFRLAGPVSDASVVRLDEIAVHAADNAVPIAQGETVHLAEGGSSSTVEGGGASLLANDADGDPAEALTVETAPVIGPFFGSVVLQADGAFVYTHDGSETTSDRFVYRVSDGRGGFADATVVIMIDPVNDQAPLAGADVLRVEPGGGSSVLVGGATSLLANDGDLDLGDSLTMDLTPVQGPAHGELVLHADGTFQYTHSGDDATSDQFVYQVRDAAGNLATAQVTVVIAQAGAWHNASNPFDVNADLKVSITDLVVLIGDLRLKGFRDLAGELTPPPPFVDVNGDDRAGLSDVLDLVTHLRDILVGAGEGESDSPATDAAQAPPVWLPSPTAPLGPTHVAQVSSTIPSAPEAVAGLLAAARRSHPERRTLAEGAGLPSELAGPGDRLELEDSLSLIGADVAQARKGRSLLDGSDEFRVG